LGTQKLGGGAQHVGQGGLCSERQNYTTYGSFDAVPFENDLGRKLNQLGSMGTVRDVETAGGGRLVILTKALHLEGVGAALQSNAKPFKENSAKPGYQINGGSGGYIYIKTVQA
jgi:hypothetical protein